MPNTQSKAQQEVRQYFPRRLALVAPQGEFVHEFVVTGKDRIGILSEISTVFAKHFVSLTSVDIDTVASGDFVLVTFADFRNSDASSDQVLKEVTALKSVKTVVCGSASDALFERFMFPITAGGSNRAIILPASALMGYEKVIVDKGRDGGEEHLIATGRPVGLGITNTLRAYMPWADAPALVAAATEAMRALGWGLCSFDLAKISEGSVSVMVRNPLFAGTGTPTVSWLLIGVISGLLENLVPFPNRLSGRPTVSKESDISFELVAA